MKKRINIMIDESLLPLIDNFANMHSMSRSEYFEHCFLQVADEHFISNWDLYTELKVIQNASLENPSSRSLSGLVCSLHNKIDILADKLEVKFPDFL